MTDNLADIEYRATAMIEAFFELIQEEFKYEDMPTTLAALSNMEDDLRRLYITSAVSVAVKMDHIHLIHIANKSIASSTKAQVKLALQHNINGGSAADRATAKRFAEEFQ